MFAHKVNTTVLDLSGCYIVFTKNPQSSHTNCVTVRILKFRGNVWNIKKVTD